MSSNPESADKKKLIVSYLTLRRTIGILGISLPVLLFLYSCFKSQGIQLSISLYYFTQMRNEFVVILSLVSLFLICYKGYDNDKYYSNAAGFFGLVVAFVHANYKNSNLPCVIPDFNTGEMIREIVHLGSAALFLGLLAYMSFFLFTKTSPENKLKGILPGKKKTRNLVYRICAILIFLCLALMILYFALKPLRMKCCEYKPIFWLESISLWAFGFSWLVKGETLWKD